MSTVFVSPELSEILLVTLLIGSQMGSILSGEIHTSRQLMLLTTQISKTNQKLLRGLVLVLRICGLEASGLENMMWEEEEAVHSANTYFCKTFEDH